MWPKLAKSRREPFSIGRSSKRFHPLRRLGERGFTTGLRLLEGMSRSWRIVMSIAMGPETVVLLARPGARHSVLRKRFKMRRLGERALVALPETRFA